MSPFAHTRSRICSPVTAPNVSAISRMPASPDTVRDCFVHAFIVYLRSCSHPLSHHTWQQRRPACPVEANGQVIQFTVFGMAEYKDENQVMELLRPEWDNNGPKGLEFAVRFDMQLQVLRDLLWAHGLPCDLPSNNIIVKLPDIAVERKVTRWTAVFLICSLTVSEKPDVYTGQLYKLDVKEIDHMYCNID